MKSTPPRKADPAEVDPAEAKRARREWIETYRRQNQEVRRVVGEIMDFAQEEGRESYLMAGWRVVRAIRHYEEDRQKDPRSHAQRKKDRLQARRERAAIFKKYGVTLRDLARSSAIPEEILDPRKIRTHIRRLWWPLLKSRAGFYAEHEAWFEKHRQDREPWAHNILDPPPRGVLVSDPRTGLYAIWQEIFKTTVGKWDPRPDRKAHQTGWATRLYSAYFEDTPPDPCRMAKLRRKSAAFDRWFSRYLFPPDKK